MTAVEAAVPGALAGERLDRIVSVLADCTRTQASALVASGAVVVDGEVTTKGAIRLAAGTRVVITGRSDPDDRGPEPDRSVEFAVAYEDDDVIVVDKPAGLVVHPGSGNPDGTLVHGLLAAYPEIVDVGPRERPGIVHRLDKDTSGLLLVARTPDAFRSLTAQLRARTIERRYLALVWGHLDAARGLIDAPIGRSTRTPTRMAVSARGREARTSYEIVEEYAEPTAATLVWCSLDTGRTHQIRVHLAAIGHPVVDDARYGGGRGQVVDVGRFFLHAARLGFDHPTTAERLELESPLPEDLTRALERFAVSRPRATAARREP